MQRNLKPLLLTLLLIAVAFAVNAQDAFKVVSKWKYAEAWNGIEESVKRYNAARTELGDNITSNPPWSVVSESKEARRRELYDAAIKEAETQAELYKRLRDEDR